MTQLAKLITACVLWRDWENRSCINSGWHSSAILLLGRERYSELSIITKNETEWPSQVSKTDLNRLTERRANARNVSFVTLYSGYFMLIDNAKLSCYTLPPTQHHSFSRHLPPFRPKINHRVFHLLHSTQNTAYYNHKYFFLRLCL